MSALPNGIALVQKKPAQPRTKGFLHIVRHGAGINVFYILTYHRLDRIGARPKAMLAEGAQALIDLLERIGVGGYSAAWFGKHPGPVAERRRNAGKGNDRGLAAIKKAGTRERPEAVAPGLSSFSEDASMDAGRAALAENGDEASRAEAHCAGTRRKRGKIHAQPLRL
jgi:hypothetical protein